VPEREATERPAAGPQRPSRHLSSGCALDVQWTSTAPHTERVERFKKRQDKWVGECKKEADKGKVKKCLDKSCKDFRKWIKNSNM